MTNRFEYRVHIDGAGIADTGLKSLEDVVRNWKISDDVTVQRSKKGKWKTVPAEEVLAAAAATPRPLDRQEDKPADPPKRRLSAAERLEWLADARSAYLSPGLQKKIANDEVFSFDVLDHNDQVIYAQVSGMRHAAQALRGDDMWGWLPSWYWDDWKDINTIGDGR
ncbi:hypothetical protein [Agromyces humi]|uniref:hypothetical protein n=1 Tax=Agromyces humi TaxID=1766800 RepID=UPI001359CE9A|nr:hypothetical protein [Agromyces humi]